jgi:hypothetical protein
MVQLRGVHVLASIISTSDPLIGFFIWGFVRDKVLFLLMHITLNKMKDQILTAAARSEQPLLKNVGHKVKYCLDVCRTQMEHILNVNRAQKMDFNFVWL